MQTFFPARGCVYKVSDPTKANVGFYNLKGLKSPGNAANILIQGVDLEHSDIVQQVVGLDNSKTLYTFGTAFGTVAVYGEILMGPGGSTGDDGFGTVLEFFNDNRVSKSKKPVILSMPDSTTISVYLRGLSIGRIDPEYHIQPFVFVGAIADIDSN